ncbi:MAG: adenylate/guanylate cyclase domain-containing protein [bacterium]|nr:adenylate/guanylate cyclase domain-containing protein [bacterium]
MHMEYSELLREYERLYKQQRILVKTGDIQQWRLNKRKEQADVESKHIKTTFSRYLSGDVVDTILETPEGAALGGETRVITLLMSDLRGFTAITERLPAENVVGILNIYLSIMTDVIFKHRGTIDEFIGDGILALFGAPQQQQDDAVRAVACAVEMQNAMAEVNKQNRKAGYPELEMGIGINTGELVVGNIGSPKRIKYGVVGSNINLTARIESYTVGGQIFISESTRESCGPILRIDDRMSVMPKGVAKPIPIYEIGGIYSDYNIFIPQKEKIQLITLTKPIKVRFSIVTGNYVANKTYTGEMKRIGAGEAEIHSPRNVRKLSELKISVLNEKDEEIVADIYGRVVENIADTHAVFRINFTSVTPEARHYIETSPYR